MGFAYAVAVEKAPDNYCAYVPDLPGCVATGQTRAEIFRRIAEAIAFHIEGLKEDGLPVPEPQSSTAMVKVWGGDEIRGGVFLGKIIPCQVRL